MNNIINDMKKWRHYLHQHPQTAFEEYDTMEYIAAILSDLGLIVHRNIGKTGIVADLKVGTSDKVIGLRTDIDAINLQETTTLAYKSVNDNKMHACGHDGHTAILLGVAATLAKTKDFNGTVRFIFQPAEEPGHGALAMINDGLFTKFPMDEIYGLHNRPNYPQNNIYVCKGGIMASEDNFTIKIKGKGSHASSPNLGKDPLVVAAQVILGLQMIISRNMNPVVPAVISCTEIFSDGAHNAIGSNVTILGDTRSNTLETQKLLERRMEEVVKGICLANEVDYDFLYTHEFMPTINNDKCVDVVVEAANKVVDKEMVHPECEPWMASEDFAYYLQKIPGCFFFLGSKPANSEEIPVHNSNYDYNDDVLETGVNLFKEIVCTRLKK